jgi:GNAT superfamily N-acetyltransferase
VHVISLSAIDQERFGIVTARDPLVTPATLNEALDFCRSNAVEMLIARCSTDDLSTAQRLEDAGGRLMDVLVYYTRVVVKGDLPENTCKCPIRSLREGDAEAVRDVATQTFKGYYGHYHADHRLDRKKCDEAYESWAYRSCTSRDPSTEVLVADDGAIAGFATLRLNDPREGEGVLFGVAPRAQGAGIYRGFMVEGMRWCREQGAKRMVVSTQVTNLAVQKVWTRLGFEPDKSFYTFHVWFDPRAT